MKKIKRPNTIKMKRLLIDFIDCDVTNRTMLRELQEDARRVIYFDESLQPGQRKSPPARKPRKAAAPKKSRKKTNGRTQRTRKAAKRRR